MRPLRLACRQTDIETRSFRSGPTVLNLYVALMRQDFSWLVRTRRCREITTIEVSYSAIGDLMHAMNLYLYGIGLRERP